VSGVGQMRTINLNVNESSENLQPVHEIAPDSAAPGEKAEVSVRG
jgi:hypothetical protein